MNKRVLIIGGVVIVMAFIFMVSSMGKKPDSTRVQAASSPSSKELHAQAQQMKKNRDILKARRVYQEILKNHPDAENIDQIQKELETLNMDVIFSTKMLPNKTAMHEVVAGDTLGKMAKKYGTTIELIQKSNNLKSDIIRIGQKLRVWTGKFNMLIDKSQNILILKDGNQVIKVYDVSTGENNSTPVGTFKVTTKLLDPVWFNRGVVVPPESPHNVLGTRWLGFDLPGYGIHGTIDPQTIGNQVTAGCVRMRNEEVEELYSMIPMGTEVFVVD